MEELRIYSLGILFSILAAGVAFLLIPSKQVAKPFRIAISVAILIVLVAPIKNLSETFIEITSSAESQINGNENSLEETQKKQMHELALQSFSDSVKDILETNGIIPSDVHIYVTDESDDIKIYGIVITLDSSTTAIQKQKAQRLVTEIFGIEPSIEIER